MFAIIIASALVYSSFVPAHNRETAANRETAPNQPELLYSPATDLEAADVRLISTSKHSLNIAAYTLSDRAVIQAIDDAKARGVLVRIVLDRSELHSDREAPDLVVNVRVKRGGPLMHLKAYAVDGSILRTGSANLSHGGLRLQDNDLMVIRDQSIVAAFNERFEKMWAAAQPLSEVLQAQ